MSKFINNANELNEYFKFDSSIEVSSIDNHLLVAEEDFILPVFGQTFFDEMVTAYEATLPTEKQSQLVVHIQRTVTEFAAWMAVDDFNVSFSAAGLVVTNDQQAGRAPASEARTEKLKESLKRRGFKSIDRMISFLEIYKADFPTWTSSSEYANQKKYFINTTEEFNAACNQEVPRFMFIKLLPFINQVEHASILTVTCKALFDEIKSQIVAGTVSSDNETLLRRIRPAVANLAFSKAILPLGIQLDGFGLTMHNNSGSSFYRGSQPPDNSLILAMKDDREKDGLYWQQKLSDYLKENASTYPLYQDSECFIDTSADDYLAPGVRAIDGGAIT